MDKSIHTERYKTLISHLRRKREELGITQRQLAEKLDVTQAVVSKIETCERRLDVIEFQMICEALNISYIKFLQEIL